MGYPTDEEFERARYNRSPPNQMVRKPVRPEVVCLCGSTRFYDEFQRANYFETIRGRIVLSVGFFVHSAEVVHGEQLGATPEQKMQLDELHLRKIDLADTVHFLNVGGYIGKSTRRELAYALATHKPVTFLEPAMGEKFMEDNAHELGRLAAEFILHS